MSMYVFFSISKLISINMSNTMIYILKNLNDIAFYVSNIHYSTFINLILFISFLITLYRICDTIGEPVIKARKLTIKDIFLRLKGIVKNPLKIFFILASILVIVIIRFNLYSILSIREWGFFAYAYFILSTWLPITYIIGVLKSISFSPFNIDFSLKYVKKTITYHNAKKLMVMFVCFSLFRAGVITVYICWMYPIDYSSYLIQHLTPPAAIATGQSIDSSRGLAPARTWGSIIAEFRDKRKFEAQNAGQETNRAMNALARIVLPEDSSVLIAQTYPDSSVLIEPETYRWGSATMYGRPAYIQLNSININYTSNDSVYPSLLWHKKRILDEMYNILEARSDNTSRQVNNILTFQQILSVHHSEMIRAYNSCGTGSISVNTIRSAGKYFKDCMRLAYKKDGFVDFEEVKLNLIPHTIAPTIWDYLNLRSYITKIDALTELSAVGGKRPNALYVRKNWTYCHLRRIKANNDVVFYYVGEQMNKIYSNRETRSTINEIKREKLWLN